MTSSGLNGFRSTSTAAGGYTIHAVVSGLSDRRRPDIVLVHGLGVSHRYLLPLADRLSGEFNVYLPDLPGFGRSEKPQHVLTIPELAEALEAWMDAVHLGAAALVGNSLGCQVIGELAVRRPEHMTRAVLIGPSLDPQARTPAQQIWRLFCDAFREPVSVLAIALADYAACGPRRIWRTFQHALEHDMADCLRQMRCPTLVVRGEHDLLSTADWVEQAVSLLPCGRLAVIPGAAHAAHYSAPDAAADIVRRFLHCAEDVPAIPASIRVLALRSAPRADRGFLFETAARRHQLPAVDLNLPSSKDLRLVPAWGSPLSPY